MGERRAEVRVTPGVTRPSPIADTELLYLILRTGFLLAMTGVGEQRAKEDEVRRDALHLQDATVKKQRGREAPRTAVALSRCQAARRAPYLI